jgi:hypothetical protein
VLQAQQVEAGLAQLQHMRRDYEAKLARAQATLHSSRAEAEAACDEEAGLQALLDIKVCVPPPAAWRLPLLLLLLLLLLERGRCSAPDLPRRTRLPWLRCTGPAGAA